MTGRTAVMPLFECVGLLDPRGRNGWTLYSPFSKFADGSDGRAAQRLCVGDASDGSKTERVPGTITSAPFKSSK